jgi:uncharacterized membrane protein
MKRLIQQASILVLQSVCSAGMLFAEQRVKPGEDALLQAQFLGEQQELRQEIETLQRENKHRVADPSVKALELRRAEKRDEEALRSITPVAGNVLSPNEKAKVQLALNEFNEQLPEIKQTLKQASSNSPLPAMELKPLTVDAVLSASEKSETSGSASQLAASQMIMKRMQQAMTKASPEDRKQLKALLDAMAEEKDLPLPKNLPPAQKSQLLQKGAR